MCGGRNNETVEGGDEQFVVWLLSYLFLSHVKDLVELLKSVNLELGKIRSKNLTFNLSLPPCVGSER